MLVMTQSISDWGMVNITKFFNIYICEENIKPGMSQSMNHFRGGLSGLRFRSRIAAYHGILLPSLRYGMKPPGS